MSVLLSDNFDDNDTTDWTAVSGSLWSASSGKVQLDSTEHRYMYKTFTGQQEVWMSWKMNLASVTSWTNDYQLQPRTGAGWSYDDDTIGVAFCKTGGLYYLECGVYSTYVELTSYAVSIGTEYTITARFKTGDSSDGIAQLWIDGGGYSHQQILNDTTRTDLTTGHPFIRFTIGNRYTDGQTISWTVDDVLVGTTEGDVYSPPANRKWLFGART